MSAPSNREETIFERALELDSPEAREAYLRDACGEDMALRERLQGLLAAHDRAGRFLEHKAPEPAVTSAEVDSSSRRREEGDSPRSPLVPPPQVGGYPSQGVAPLIEKPGDRIGRYKLLEQIGEGGMGTVWMAEQEEPVRRRVALKIIKLGMDTRSVIARFEAERQALALMDHPNIARVFDGGATGIPLTRPPGTLSPIGGEGRGEGAATASHIPAGRPYFVMELVRGLPITRYCEETRMPIRDRLELFTQVCRAVQHAHQKGIIHRDLKPSNILVTEQDGQPVPKVIDFGIAKATGGQLTEKTLFTDFNQVMGTPAYMSPEQAGLGSLDIDTRSDTYSLGVVLYQLLTGRPPFDTQELLKQGYDAVLRTIREVDPPKPSTRLRQARLLEPGAPAQSAPRTPHSEIDQDLDWIVMKCLEKDRNRRYETPNALAADIERYLHEEPVMARPPSTAYRMRKFARKHRTAVAVAAGFLVLLGAATVVSSLLAVWANKERTNAESARTSETAHRVAAEQERNRAKAAEVEARDVLMFFQVHVLAAARPEGAPGGLGYNVTLRAAVDAAESKIESAFTNRPLVEATIRHTLGESYRLLGDNQMVLRQHERALALRRLNLGPDDPETLESMNDVAMAYQEARRLPEAVQLHEETLRLRTRRLGRDHPDTTDSMINLGTAYMESDQPSEALRLLEEALDLKRSKFGSDDPRTFSTLDNLAHAYGMLGRLSESLALHQQSVRVHREKLGPNNIQTYFSMHHLGSALLGANCEADALPLLEETAGLLLAKLPPNHGYTLVTLSSLGEVYSRLGRHSEAFALLKWAVRGLEATHGPDDHKTLDAKESLAKACQRAERFPEALATFLEVVQVAEVAHGPSHAKTLGKMEGLADTYRAMQRLTEAVPVLQEILKRRTASQGPADDHTLRARKRLADAYRDLRQFTNALPLLEENLSLTRAKLGPDEPDTLRAMNNKAVVYAAMGQLDEAVRLYERALAGLRSKLGPDHDDTLTTTRNLALDHLALGRPALAESFCREWLVQQRNKLQPDDPDLLKTRSLLGECLLRQEKYGEAELEFRPYFTVLKAREPDGTGTLTLQSHLGRALYGQNKFKEAEPLLVEAYEGLKRKVDGRPSRSRDQATKETAKWIVHLYEAWGEQDEAAQWREKLNAPAPVQP